MRVEMYPKSIWDVSNIIEELSNMFDENAKAVNVPLNAIEKIIITDKDHWGITVDSLQEQYYGRKTGYTNDSFYTAAAKTLSKKVDNNIINTIIFNDYVIFRPSDIDKLDAEHKAFLEVCDYTIFYEFGHCLDNYLCERWQDETLDFKDGIVIEPAFIYYIPHFGLSQAKGKTIAQMEKKT